MGVLIVCFIVLVIFIYENEGWIVTIRKLNFLELQFGLGNLCTF